VTSYSDFLATKSRIVEPSGFEPTFRLHGSLFPHQRDVVDWALRMGRCAVFADTGLGKSRMQLEWAAHVVDHTENSTQSDVLILAPLAVAAQTVREGAELGLEVTLCREVGDVRLGINITNYDRLERFLPIIGRFAGVVLDESSCIKHHDAKTLARLIAAFGATPYRLCATATPAPNDFAELGTHAEFLGVCSRQEMLAEFFVHDSGETQIWRLKGHAEKVFWQWVASWAALIRKPSDFGYDDGAYQLPPLEVMRHTVEVEGLVVDPGAPMGLAERRAARKVSMLPRVAALVDVVNAEPNEPWVLWGELNAETELLASLIPDAVEVCGSDTPEFKENAARWFSGEEVSCLCGRRSNDARTCASTPSDPTSRPGSQSSAELSPPSTTRVAAPSIAATPQCENAIAPRPSNGPSNIHGHVSLNDCGHMDSLSSNTTSYSPSSKDSARSADVAEVSTKPAPSAGVGRSFMLITAIGPNESEDSSALPAISGSGSSETTRSGSRKRRCTCGAERLNQTGKGRVLISKVSIFGFGLNWQHCARMAFVGVSDSWESYYQAVRRCWRFGQTRPVNVHLFASSAEGAVVENLQRKEDDAKRLAEELSLATREVVRAAIRRVNRYVPYAPREQVRLPGWLRSAA
jgi:hypothetical protein